MVRFFYYIGEKAVMSDTNTPTNADQSRRRLLKALGLAGTGALLLPGKWFQPIVDTIISPAEADCGGASGIAIQGSGCFSPGNRGSNVSVNVVSITSDSTFA
jgi:hypothetical protein